MQYLVSVIDDTAGLATPDEMAAIDAFNDRLMAEGHWVFAGGLAAPSSATVIDNRGEEAMFTDGPFLESKEYLAGFWIMEAPDLDVALKLAAEGSKHCNRKVEVRPLLRRCRLGRIAADSAASLMRTAGCRAVTGPRLRLRARWPTASHWPG
jgi:hypothetical protein